MGSIYTGAGTAQCTAGIDVGYCGDGAVRPIPLAYQASQSFIDNDIHANWTAYKDTTHSHIDMSLTHIMATEASVRDKYRYISHQHNGDPGTKRMFANFYHDTWIFDP